MLSIPYCSACPITGVNPTIETPEAFYGYKRLTWEVPRSGEDGCCHSLISELQFRSHLQMAMREIARHCQLDFFDVTDRAGDRNANPAHLRFRFKPIDGEGRTLGQAYLPHAPAHLRGKCEFDLAEPFRLSDYAHWEGATSGIDFISVALHEIYHLLGHPHVDPSEDRDSVMLAYYQGTRRISSAGDIFRQQQNYGIREFEMPEPRNYFPDIEIPDGPNDRARACSALRAFLRG